MDLSPPVRHPIAAGDMSTTTDSGTHGSFISTKITKKERKKKARRVNDVEEVYLLSYQIVYSIIKRFGQTDVENKTGKIRSQQRRPIHLHLF